MGMGMGMVWESYFTWGPLAKGYFARHPGHKHTQSKQEQQQNRDNTDMIMTNVRIPNYKFTCTRSPCCQ